MSTFNWIRIINQQTVPQHDNVVISGGFANRIVAFVVILIDILQQF